MYTFHTHWTQADLHTRRAGLTWYARARAVAGRLSRTYHVDYRRTCAIIAVLSQRTRWDENIRSAEACLAHKPFRALNTVREKALRLRAGADLDAVVTGQKIRAFYQALAGDDRQVVIDTWMLRACGFHTEKPTALQYKRLARTLQEEAARARVAPAAYQAVVWCQARGAHD